MLTQHLDFPGIAEVLSPTGGFVIKVVGLIQAAKSKKIIAPVAILQSLMWHVTEC